VGVGELDGFAGLVITRSYSRFKKNYTRELLPVNVNYGASLSRRVPSCLHEHDDGD
jgi:hypothetical protein